MACWVGCEWSGPSWSQTVCVFVNRLLTDTDTILAHSAAALQTHYPFLRMVDYFVKVQATVCVEWGERGGPLIVTIKSHMQDQAASHPKIQLFEVGVQLEFANTLLQLSFLLLMGW